MIRDIISVQASPPETLVVFDCRERGAKQRLRRERLAWSSSATVENLGYGRVVMIVRPGSALGLAG
jgi:hypothetical protein